MYIYTYYVGYVQEIFDTFLGAHEKKELDKAAKELIGITPEAMNTMLTKQPR